MKKALKYFDDMLTRYKVVEDTQMKVFKWEDIQGYRNMRQEQFIENIVDLLVSSEQQFVVQQTVDMN